MTFSTFKRLVVRSASVLCLGLFAAGCKPPKSSQLATLDNFAAQALVKSNRCEGSDAEQRSSSVKKLVETADAPPNLEYVDELIKAVSAVPSPLRQLFLDLGGVLMLPPEEDMVKLCGPLATKAGIEVGGNDQKYEIDACYRYRKASGDAPLTMAIVLRRDPEAIRHGLVRQFGYLYAQRLSRMEFGKGADRNTGVEARKVALTNAFFNDLRHSPFFSIGTLAPLLGENGPAIVERNLAAKQRDVLKNLDLSDGRRSKLRDYIFAEAFDSYYCNAVAPVDTKAFKAIKKGDRIDAQTMKTTLASTRNTRVIMSFLFGSSLHVFNKIHPDFFRAPGGRSFGLTEEASADGDCGVQELDGFGAAANVTPEIKPQDLYNSATTVGGGTQVVGANSTLADQSLLALQGTSEPLIAGDAFLPADFSSTSPMTDSLVAMSGPAGNFNPNEYLAPVGYPANQQTAGLDPMVKAPLDAAYAWQPPADGTSTVTDGWALGVGSALKRACSAVFGGGGDAAKVAKATESVGAKIAEEAAAKAAEARRAEVELLRTDPELRRIAAESAKGNAVMISPGAREKLRKMMFADGPGAPDVGGGGLVASPVNSEPVIAPSGDALSRAATGENGIFISKSGNLYQGTVTGAADGRINLADGNYLAAERLQSAGVFHVGDMVEFKGANGPISGRVLGADTSAKTIQVADEAGKPMTLKLADLDPSQTKVVTGNKVFRNTYDNLTKSGDDGSWHAGGVFNGFTPKNATPLPEQGWKLHVSAPNGMESEVAEAVLPKLREMGIEHKIATPDGYNRLFSSDTQAGKLVTIYPRNEAQAEAIAKAMNETLEARGLADKKFVPVGGELQMGPGVYARYGQFSASPDLPVGYVRGPNGRAVPDVRGEAHPAWVKPLRVK